MQLQVFGDVLLLLGATEVHLGDCVGIDAEAHDVAIYLKLRTVGHVPEDPRMRAFKTYDDEREPYPYLIRDHHIVDESDVLIGMPRTLQEELRSGTWATIRYARRIGRRRIIISREGDIYDDDPALLAPRL